ncbi:hypothetical protein LK10_10740 [Sinomonas humi]|uniref:Uncharacterized protein n=1 Tax=Sinomonas humi TaxID=1338436 RepID=A0A0B2AI05_9MICC|nr:hypothetical protein LK10_10740 [Sinomonas humi]
MATAPARAGKSEPPAVVARRIAAGANKLARYWPARRDGTGSRLAFLRGTAFGRTHKPAKAGGASA